MAWSQTKTTFPQNQAALRAWLRDTEAGREILREAAVSTSQKLCEKCVRAPGKITSLELLDEKPPSDDKLEQRIIGMMFVDVRSIPRVLAVLRPEHFHDPRAAGLYERLLQMWDGGNGPLEIDLFMVWVREQYGLQDLDTLGGPAYLHLAMETCGLPSCAEHYAKVIFDHAKRRAIIHAATGALAGAYAADMPIGELIERTRLAIEMAAIGETY